MLKMILLAASVVLVFFIVLRMLATSAPPADGSAAPNFSLPSQDGTSVSLNAYRGKWVVLYFYPKDQTAGCTREAHNFQADQAKYDQRNTAILGVSVDSVDSHRKFCTKEGLNFKLLSDQDGAVSRAYGSLTSLGFTKFASRHTFLIDPSGKIAKCYTSVDPAGHSAEVSAEIDELQKKQADLQE